MCMECVGVLCLYRLTNFGGYHREEVEVEPAHLVLFSIVRRSLSLKK